MITSGFCEKIVFHCNLLGLKPFDPLDPTDLKKQCTQLLFSQTQLGLLVYDSYKFFIKHQKKIAKARATQKFIDAATEMLTFTKRTRVKKIKLVDSILLTNFFGDVDKPQTIEIADDKFNYQTITKSDMKEAKKAGKNYKVIEGDDGVSYIFDKSYIESIGKDEADIDKAIACYFMEMGDKERYVYYINVNTDVGKDAALRNVARIQALKAAQAAICMSIITTNTLTMMNLRRF